MKKGDIVKGSHRGKDKAKHFIVFLDDTNKETFVGGVFTHSNKFKDNILMKTEHFKPDGFKFDNTYLVKGRFIKLRNWGPFTKIGEMTEMGLEFIENQTSGLQPRSWDEYINILKK